MPTKLSALGFGFGMNHLNKKTAEQSAAKRAPATSFSPENLLPGALFLFLNSIKAL
jgi:hypothetical protein